MSSKRHEEIIDADTAIRHYYENEPASEAEGFRDETEPVTQTMAQGDRPPQTDEEHARLSGGDADTAPQDLDIGTETPGGSNPTPDQDLVDAIGEAVGITYQDNEPLKFGDKIAARDESRWELNPASSEDYAERAGAGSDGPSEISPPPTDNQPSPRRSRKPSTAKPRESRGRKRRSSAS